MKKSSTYYLFIKWFIVFALIIAVTAIAAKLGFLALIVTSDVSHLSVIIFALFIFSSLLTGKLCFDLSNATVDPLVLKKRMKILNFIAGSFFTLGLLGTIVGFCYMMAGNNSVFNGSQDVSQIITQLKVGSSTKLYATLSGLVSSLLLQIQILLIELDLTTLDEEEKEA